jgi:cytochrome b6-f complex iron-sulfur subunit
LKISREKFIRLGTALGVGAAGASLAACGGGAGSGGGSGGKKSGGDSGGGDYGGGNSGGGGSDKGSKAPGGAVTFKDAGSQAVLVRLENGDFVAYSAVCTHQRCTVAYKKGQLVCPCHGSVFDPAEGAAVIAGPAPKPLTEIPVKVENGDIVKA